MRKKRLSPQEAAAKNAVVTPQNTEDKSNKVNENVILQYREKETNIADIYARIRAEVNPDIEIKDVSVYIKPEENAIYYVANGEITGKLDL